MEGLIEMKERIKEILCYIKSEDSLTKESIPENADIINDIGLDSLQLINFLLRVEDEFGIQVDFDNLDLSCFESLDAFCTYLNLNNNENIP